MSLNQQKELIIAYRESGMPYKEIAELTDTTEQFCRTVCSRANRKKQDNQLQLDGACRFCGKQLEMLPGAKPKQFCDGDCRNNFFNRKRAGTSYICVCKNCGRKFVSLGNPEKLYCSRDCRTLAERMR